jgi:hypothetical protein
MKTYTLFTSGPGGRITNKSIDYSKGGYPWMAKVRAKSVEDANRLLKRQIAATTPRGEGVVSLDISSGPSKNWPWAMDRDTVASQWRE